MPSTPNPLGNIPAPDATAMVASAARAVHASVLGITIVTAEQAAIAALQAALPLLLPGMYVTHERADDVRLSTIWRDNPSSPSFPDELMARTRDNEDLFDAIAALLPDRSDEALEQALADSASGMVVDLGDFTQYADDADEPEPDPAHVDLLAALQTSIERARTARKED